MVDVSAAGPDSLPSRAPISRDESRHFCLTSTASPDLLKPEDPKRDAFALFACPRSRDRLCGRWVPWYGRPMDRRAFARVLCSGSVSPSMAASALDHDDDLAGWLDACARVEPFEMTIVQGPQRWRATVTSVEVRSDA